MLNWLWKWKKQILIETICSVVEAETNKAYIDIPHELDEVSTFCELSTVDNKLIISHVDTSNIVSLNKLSYETLGKILEALLFRRITLEKTPNKQGVNTKP